MSQYPYRMTTPAPAMDLAERERCFRKGRELLHARAYFDCHEIWEDLWRQSAGPEKQLLQGLIQAAVGAHHWQHGNPVGARRVWTRSRLNLRTAAPLLSLVDVLAALQSALEMCLELKDGEEMPPLSLALDQWPPARS